MTKAKIGTAAYVSGFLDGKTYRLCGTSLPRDLLSAADDYTRGLRAGYEVGKAGLGSVQPCAIRTVLALSSRQNRRELVRGKS